MVNETTAVADRDVESYRLPGTVTPERYDIKLIPDLEKFTFAGEESIEVAVHQPVTEVILNAAELDIRKVAFLSANGKQLEGAIALDAERERATFTFPEPLEPGRGSLSITFTGVLNDKLHGFYRSTYKDDRGEQKVIATTQFEATDARRAFPCWDEPDRKAVFKVRLVVDQHLTAISNAAVVSETPVAGTTKKEVVFADTIKMSTYLVAFIVGEFEGSEPIEVDGSPIRIWSVQGKKHLSKFARRSAQASTGFFSKYYGIPYPGDKMDLIAIPDFASGAMENLGAITFRENALLVDESAASHAELERIADVVAHEIAHMWFGDLVTMKWWNGLWLNEAFATFMEMLAVDAWKPEWKRWETFGVSRAAAFAVDGLRSTRPIEFPVRHPDEASAMFDVLTYEKGASVLRMLEQYLGGEAFRQGICHYLKKHEYANAETTDLWDALEESSKQPVRQLMDSWIFQGGYPLMSAELASTKSITLCQQRFFYLAEGEPIEQTFHIPVMLRAKTKAGLVSKKLLLNKATASVDFDSDLEWLVVNEGGHGFYRVRYSPELLGKLKANLGDCLAPVERFNLLSDTWAAVVAGLSPLSEYVSLVQLFRQETDKNVWALIIGSLNYLNRAIPDDLRPGFEAFVRNLVGPAHKRLGWQPAAGEDELTRQLRGMLAGAMGTLGNDPDTQKEAADFYRQHKTDEKSVDPNVVPAVVSILAHSGGEDLYNEFTKEYKAARTPQEEQRYLFSLAGFRKQNLLSQTLERSISGEVRTQNAPYLVQSVLNNVAGRELAWQFFKSKWDTMVQLFPENSIPRMCEGVTCLVAPELEDEVRQFFDTHKVKQGGKTIDQHLERLRVAVLFQKRELANFASQLSWT
jgi:puromycin-sensitive aminopeptidase